MLFKVLREEIQIPIHFHTHDTSGISAASVLAAVDAGVDAVDAAMDAFSGLTSQPCLGSIVSALRGTERCSGLDPATIRKISFYWKRCAPSIAPGERPALGGVRGSSPRDAGGQFTNLKEQARALGLEAKGTTSPRPMPTSTACSATSSR